MNNSKAEGNFLLRASANLSPGYFALVMATGIISIACHFLEMSVLAFALLAINIIAFVLLSLLLFIRLVLFFARIKDDINNHVRGLGSLP